MKKSFGSLLLMMGVALLSAASLEARQIQVTGVTVLWSTLSPAPTVADEISITGGGTLYVDVNNAVVGKLTIGNGSSAGSLLFDTVGRTLSVAGDVIFSDNVANALNMSNGTAVHTLEVGGKLLPAGGAGTFNTGLGTIIYGGAGDQTVTAKIGTSTIQYKDLTLKGGGTKTVESNVTVQGKLSLQGTAKVAGTSAITYGGLASLEYKGSAAQTTTGIEWPATGMYVPVTIINAAGVKLEANKATSSKITITDGKLDNDGKDLTTTGDIENNSGQTGAGRVILNGTTVQALSGQGHYGNLVLDNPAGALTSSIGLFVDGRLNVARGRLTLPTGAAGTTALLSLGGVDQSTVGTHGSSTSGATYKSDTYWAGGGMITLAASKLDSGLTLADVPTITFGTASVTFTGKVTGGALGNGPVNGELVTVSIATVPLPISKTVATTGGDGSFSAQFDTATLAAGQYQVTYQYQGGINLKPANTQRTPGLIINKLTITVTPDNVAKTYGNPDPPLTYSYAPAMAPGDNPTGQLGRVAGEAVGSYEINAGTLTLPANYSLAVASGKKLTINKRDLSVIAEARSKIYGDVDPDLGPKDPVSNPDGTYIISPPSLVGTDTLDLNGKLGRTAGEDVSIYPMNLGTFKIVNGGADVTGNYNITFVSANLTINKKAVSVSVAAENLQKTYGSADPAFTPIFTPALAQPPGSAAADTHTGGLKRASGETAGSYAMNLGDLKIVNGDKDKTGNYSLTLAATSSQFVIKKKPVTISAVDKTVTYGTKPADYRGSLVVYTGLIDPQKTTTTPATLGGWKPSEPVEASVPGAYEFTVNTDAADQNYEITYGIRTKNLTISKANLVVTADNKTKVQDGSTFPSGSFTASYNFVAGDTVATAFTKGALAFKGDATTATTAGTYTIDPSASTYESAKYNIAYATGLLTITTGIGTKTVEGPQTWAENGSHSWQINQANGGTAGSSPGWNLLKIKATSGGAAGTLTISATEAAKFKIYLTTLMGSSPVAGPMAKFDPSRPYRWKIVETTGGITGFAANKFQLVWNGPGLFANSIFGGTFGVEATANDLYVTFTPMSQFLVDAAGLRDSLLTSDVDVLYAEATPGSIAPQETVTIAIKVANLQQPIFGAQAFLKFDSTYFVAAQTGAGAPVVAPGGGVWDKVIYKLWQGDGKLDTVLGLSFSAPLGTSSDGTVALVTLTPTRTATGKSRVVFRADDDLIGLTGGTLLSGALGQPIWPGRAPTSDITVQTDDKGPVIDLIAATQAQYGVQQNILNGPSSKDDPAYSTNTVRGAANIAVTAHDLPGVGLKQQPTVTLTSPDGSKTVDVTCNNPGTGDGTFSYTWNVDGSTANGKWTGKVTAVDMANPSKVTEKTFHLTVNNNQVTGVVELDAFRASQRVVTFLAGDGAAVLKAWDLSLDFTGTLFMSAGGFSDVPALASELLAPTSQMSTLLRYGAVADLEALSDRLLFGTDGLATDIREMIFGYITNLDGLKDMAGKLKNPQRSIDVYILGELSNETLDALNNFNLANPSAAQIAALENGLLSDFSIIVVGPNIYDPLRFASVTWPPATADEIIKLLAKPTLTAAETARLNRLLLNAAYLPYVFGSLSAWTGPALLAYTGGADAALAGYILGDFDTLTLGGASLYTEVRFLGIPLRAETQTLILKKPPVAGVDLVKLNRLLLEDGFAVSLGVLNYSAGLLQPQTTATLAGYLAVPPTATQAAVEAALVADLNAAMNAGIVTRSALESAYPTQITKAKWLAPYTLIHVPAAATKVSAKTAWNVRETLDVTGLPSAVANFVNQGLTPATFDGDDHYLRAGDCTADNAVNLADFAILQQTYGSATDLRSDFNGDGAVNILDYNLITKRFGVIGDAGVDGKP